MATTLQAHPDARRGREVSCPMCGSRFDPGENTACAGCPMNLGCALACCPRCGLSCPDPSASVLVRALQRLKERRS